MASAPVTEWVGLQQFPAATQTRLTELLENLKQENVDSLTILVMGRTGAGKSSTVNSLIGEQAIRVSSYQTEEPAPTLLSRSWAGFKLHLIDTPGLVEYGCINRQAIDLIKGFLLNKTIDVLLYVDRLDVYRVDDLDQQVVRAITDAFGKNIWSKSLLVLTRAQFRPPHGIPYADFSAKRSLDVRKTVCSGAQIGEREFENLAIPVVLVENSGICDENEDGEKILPNGEVWIPNLMKAITSIATNRSQPIVVDKKLIEGVDPNERGKLFIPLLIVAEWLVFKLVQCAIKKDTRSSSSS